MINSAFIHQPSQLYRLIAVYMCERFGYFWIRSVLTLYMIKILLFSTREAYSIFAAFSALLYLAPLLGGYIADQLIGNRRATIMGGGLLSLGLVLLGMPGDTYIYIALGVIICGKGLYAPSITTALGGIYQQNDSRREGGFSLMYAAINVSAIIPPIIAAGFVFYFGWHCAFDIAGLITLLGTIFFSISTENKIEIKRTSFYACLLIVASIVIATYLFAFLIQKTQLINITIIIFSSILILYTFKITLKLSESDRKKLLMCFFLTIFSIIFVTLSQQSSMSLTVFTEYNVERNVGSWNIPTYFFLALNPFFIITCAPILSCLWFKLGKVNLNPSISIKFAVGTIFLGIGFIVLLLAMTLMQSASGKINFPWVILSYFLQSISELLIYPIGLAMMTEFAPKQIKGFMVGIWYFATAVASSLAGFISNLTIIPSGIHGPLQTAIVYKQVFGLAGWIAIVAGLVLLGIVIFVSASPKKITENYCLTVI